MNDQDWKKLVLEKLGRVDERTHVTALQVSRIEGKQDTLSAELRAHEKRDDDRIGGLEGRVGELEQADATSRQRALTEAQAELRTVRTSGDERSFQTWKAVGIAILGGVVTFLVALAVQAALR